MSSNPNSPEDANQLTPFGTHAPTPRAAHVEVLSRADRGGALDGFFELEDETSPGSNQSGTPLHLLAMLRYKWSMAAVFLIIAGSAIPAIWMLIVPMYEARAVIRVSPIGTRIAFETENNGMMPFYTSFLNSQLNIINSREVLEAVLDDRRVQNTEWFRNSPEPLLGPAGTQLERLREDLMARPRSKTELIDVALSARNGNDAQVIVDAVVHEYLRVTKERLRELDEDRIGTLEEQKDRLGTEIDDFVRSRSELAQQIGSGDPVTRLSQANDVLLELIKTRNNLTHERQQVQDDLEAMPAREEATSEAGDLADESGAESADDSQDSGVLTSPRFFKDAEWRRLQTGVTNSRHILESARQQYGPSHPRITALSADVEYAERLLQTREAQLIEEWKDAPFGDPTPRLFVEDEMTPPTRAMLERRLRHLDGELEARKAGIAEWEVEVKRIGGIAAQFATIDEQLAYKRETRDLLMKRIEALELEQNAPARITLASSAVASSRPSKDRRPIFSAMAFCGAIAAAMAVGYLRLMSDQRVHEVGEARKTSSAPFLGQLPVLPTAREILPACTPAIMEDVRMVRTALLERINGSRGGASVLVTSSSAQAGKTSVTILLAQSLAGLGKRVLLVEGDLRHPTLADRLNLNGQTAGLASILIKQTADEAAITRPRRLDFDVLPAGDVSNGFNPDLLANGAMSDALARWKKNYDVVLLDSPPVLAVADVRILGGLCDGTMMVMRSAHCRRADVMESYAMLAASGCTLLGTVLVGGSRRPGYSAYYGSYGNGKANGSAPPQLAAPATAETGA